MMFPSSIHNPRSAIRAKRHGFALPMTIIAIAGLTLLLVGLLTVLSLERKTARSYSDAARADLAVESGLAVALGSLVEIAGRDDSIVFRVEDPLEPTVPADDRPLGIREQFFTYGAVFENGAWRGIPLFSGEGGAALGATRLDINPLTTSLANYVDDAVAIGRQTEHDHDIPRAKWVEVPSSDPDGYGFRYSYWIEDLSGRIDGKNAGTEPQDLRLSTAELDMSTIFDPTSASGKVPSELTSKQQQLHTPASVRTVLSPEDAKRIEPFIHFYGTPPATPSPKVIPQGFGYAEAGTPAPDLNELVAAANVDAIAEQIGENLPLLNNRKGGFPSSENYLKTLAASIIDYADTDNNATIGTGYRGVDSYPFVNELFDRYEWTSGTSNSVKITVETYVELWNPSNRPVTGLVSFLNENRHDIRVPPNASQKFTNMGPIIKPATIPPNGFLVLSIGSKVYSFPASSSFPPSELIFSTTTTSNYSLRWNGRIVDRARGGLQRTDGNLKFGNGARKWKGNSSPALDYSIGQTGDPRASVYVNTWVFANNYDANTNWGGRCLKRDIGNSNYNEVRIPSWPDSGTNSTPGTKAPGDATRPTAVAYPANQPTMAPAFISNAGRYHSLGEIGNIFDPAQLTNVNSSNPVGNANAGGGFTLAIGRPEFGAFDKDGQRSAQILDLFSIRPDVSASGNTGRPVNINTAPREVLRSLVAGVKLDADPATLGVTVPTNAQIGDIFADFVLAQRKAFPLRGPSDLNNIRKNPATPRNPASPADTPFFGSRDAYKAGTAPAATWDDAGREELFRKTINLVTFTSKTFRIVVAGEALDKAGKVIGRSAREYHYSVEPRRDASTGEILTDADGNPQDITITKHYEKSL
jgi:hypothetical protein